MTRYGPHGFCAIRQGTPRLNRDGQGIEAHGPTSQYQGTRWGHHRYMVAMHAVAHTKTEHACNIYTKLEKCTEQAGLILWWKHTWLQL